MNISQQSFWQLGDREFPLAESVLEADKASLVSGANFVSVRAEQWSVRSRTPVSNSLLDPMPCDVPPWKQTCQELFGLGMCVRDFSQAQIAQMATYTDILDSIIANLTKEHSEQAPLLLYCWRLLILMATSLQGSWH